MDDLPGIEGKAELIAGRIVRSGMTGELAATTAENVFVALRVHVRTNRVGTAHADGVGYAVRALRSGRETFAPDVSFYAGTRGHRPAGFVEGPPDFAVEVRSANDYGPQAERELEAKRADYFEAGTLVVWDVDPVAETVTKWVLATGETGEGVAPASTTFRKCDAADAEPAVPGWRIAVDEVFAR